MILNMSQRNELQVKEFEKSVLVEFNTIILVGDESNKFIIQINCIVRIK